MNYDDENNEELDEQDDMYDNEDSGESPSRADEIKNQARNQAKNQVKNQVKNGVRQAGKQAGKAIGRAISTGMKKLFATLLVNPYFWIVVAVLFIIIVVIYLLGKISASTYTDSVDNFINNLPDSEVKTLYESRKTLIYFNLDDINKIYDSFVNDDKGERTTIADLKKKFKNGNVGNDGITIKDGAVSVNEQREIYKHILLTEKYNFNNIKWTEYNHDGTIKDAELTVDKPMGMQYPNDTTRTLDSFISMTMPYIQSWYIPLSMYSASGASKNLTDNEITLKNAEFAYQIISKAYSNISINRYNKQTYEKVTDRLEYTYQTYTWHETTDAEGNVTGGYYVLSGSGPGTRGEELVSENTSVTSEYALVEAKTFDIVEKNEYQFIPYDTKNIEDYSNELNEPYSETIYSGNSYTVRTGTRFIKTRVWNDKLLPLSQSQKSTYTVADIEQTIGSFKNESSREYYKYYEGEQKIDKLDFLNANPDVFSKYITAKEKYDENVGFTKAYLTFSYDILKDLLKDIGKDSGGYPYIYGQSLGIVGLNFSMYGSGGMWTDFGNLVIDPSISIILPIDKKYAYAIRDTIISRNPIVYGYSGHTGVDISPNHSEFTDESKFFTSVKFSSISTNPFVKGPPVYAPVDGTIYKVTYSEYNKYYSTGNNTYGTSGATVTIRDANGVLYMMTHLFPNKALFDALKTRVNGPIQKGELIGNVGNTGNSTGPHLHYEVVPTTSSFGQKNGEYTMAMIQIGLGANVSYETAQSNAAGAIKLKNGVTITDLPSSIRSFHTNLMKYSGYIEKYSKENNISTLWVMTQIAAESSFDPNSSNGNGGQGLMQLEWAGDGNYASLGYSKQQLLDPELNLRLGVAHYANAYKAAGNSYYEAMGRYNRGTAGFNNMKKQVGFSGIAKNIQELNFIYTVDKYPGIPQKRQDYYDAFNKYYYIEP